MPPAEPPLVQLDRLLKQGDAAGALRVADQMIAQSRRTFGAWLGRAVALMNLGQIAEADASVAEALKLSPGDAQAKLIQAMLDQRLGRIERAVAALAPIAASRSPQAVEAGELVPETGEPGFVLASTGYRESGRSRDSENRVVFVTSCQNWR